MKQHPVTELYLVQEARINDLPVQVGIISYEANWAFLKDGNLQSDFKMRRACCAPRRPGRDF